jgi:hypothetical protein
MKDMNGHDNNNHPQTKPHRPARLRGGATERARERRAVRILVKKIKPRLVTMKALGVVRWGLLQAASKNQQSSSRPKTSLAVTGNRATEILSGPDWVSVRVIVAASAGVRLCRPSTVRVRPASIAAVTLGRTCKSRAGVWKRRAGFFSSSDCKSIIAG